MDNIDKFTAMLNSCTNPLRIYNALRMIAEPPFEQSDDVRKKREIIVGKVAGLVEQSESL